jgi:glycosyltransferase involved in cell wall biosynthesis
MLDDSQLRDRLARAARTRVDDYTWDGRGERLEALLADVIDTRR